MPECVMLTGDERTREAEGSASLELEAHEIETSRQTSRLARLRDRASHVEFIGQLAVSRARPSLRLGASHRCRAIRANDSAARAHRSAYRRDARARVRPFSNDVSGAR